MTKVELIQQLESLPDDAEIILQVSHQEEYLHKVELSNWNFVYGCGREGAEYGTFIMLEGEKNEN